MRWTRRRVALDLAYRLGLQAFEAGGSCAKEDWMAADGQDGNGEREDAAPASCTRHRGVWRLARRPGRNLGRIIHVP